MTPSEFKAWFDGFTEAFTGCPTKAQWSRIKTRVAEIDGKPVTERVYVDRYWTHHWQPSLYWQNTGIGVSNCGNIAQASNAMLLSNSTSASPVTFDSCAAMADLGRADAIALAA